MLLFSPQSRSTFYQSTCTYSIYNIRLISLYFFTNTVSMLPGCLIQFHSILNVLLYYINFFQEDLLTRSHLYLHYLLFTTWTCYICWKNMTNFLIHKYKMQFQYDLNLEYHIVFLNKYILQDCTFLTCGIFKSNSIKRSSFRIINVQ